MKIVFRYLVPLFLGLVFVGGLLLIVNGEDEYTGAMPGAIQSAGRLIAGALLMSAALRGLTQGRRQGGE